MKEKVLMAAHQFPPVGGSGVQRTAKFVKYIGRFGWEPVVLTRDITGLQLKDESLVSDIPASTRIYRSTAWNMLELPKPLLLLGKIINRKVLIPDGERLWQLSAQRLAERVVKEEGIDLIYTTSYPFSSHLMGLHLKKKFPGIPWVADFRDEWTKNPNIQDYNYNFIRRKMEENMEASVLLKADCVIANTPVMLENFIEGRDFLRNKFYVIPNGYDEEDFEGIPVEEPKNDIFTVTYTGLLYGRRKPDLFLEAVKEFLYENSVDKSKIRINLIGHFNKDILNKLVSKLGLEGAVCILPYMKHGESIRQLMKSDALLLVAGAGEEAFYLGKIFEYMRTGRPIIAVVPEKGAAAELIRETQTGLVADSCDVNKIKESIAALFKSWQNSESIISPVWSKVKRYERSCLAGELSKVFAQAQLNAGIVPELHEKKSLEGYING